MIKRGDIKFRVGSTSKPGNEKPWAMALVYIDARTAQEELDSQFGEDGWHFTWSEVFGHPYAVHGVLKCKFEDSKWIVREDVGYPQANKMTEDVNDSESLKDAVSDALKRCAVQFGIGRFLYDAPTLFTYNVKVNVKGYVSGFTPDGERELTTKIDTWYKLIEKENENS